MAEAELRARLLAHLHELARERDPDLAPQGHAHVKAYLWRELSRWGTVTAHPFDHLGRTHHNLSLDLPGREGHAPVLIGAHFDAVPGSPGADDNATALAALLELARALAEAPPRRPVRLVAFDLEERHQHGSRAFATAMKARREPLTVMIGLEMLGYRDASPGSQTYPPGLSLFYPDTGDFIGLIGNLRTLPMLLRLRRAMRQEVACEILAVPLRGRIVPDTRRSDHAPFWDCGYPAIMVTDTANMRNPHYHRPSDRIETLDPDFLAGVCRGLAGGIGDL